MPSCLRSSLCQRISLTCSLFLNKRFKRGIRGKYHITFAAIFFLQRSPTTSPGSSHLIFYRAQLQTGQQSKCSYCPIEDTVIWTRMYLLHLQTERANNPFCFIRCRWQFVTLGQNLLYEFQ